MKIEQLKAKDAKPVAMKDLAPRGATQVKGGATQAMFSYGVLTVLSSSAEPAYRS